MSDPLTIVASASSIGSFTCDAIETAKPFLSKISRRSLMEVAAKDLEYITTLLEILKDCVETDSDKRLYRALTKKSTQNSEELNKVYNDFKANRFKGLRAYRDCWQAVGNLQQQIADDRKMAVRASLKIRLESLDRLSKKMQGSLTSIQGFDACFDPYTMDKGSQNPFSDQCGVTESVGDSPLGAYSSTAPFHSSNRVEPGEGNGKGPMLPAARQTDSIEMSNIPCIPCAPDEPSSSEPEAGPSIEPSR